VGDDGSLEPSPAQIEYRLLTFDGDECPDGLDWRVVLWAKGQGQTIPDYAVRVFVMRAMGWDYWTYCNQPLFVIDQVMMFLGSEGEGHKQANK